MKSLAAVFSALVIVNAVPASSIAATPNSNSTIFNFNKIKQNDGYQSIIAGLRAELAIRLHPVFYPEVLGNLFFLHALPPAGNARGGTVSVQSSISERIADMTVDEKIGQMILAGVSGTSLNASTIRLIDEYQIGGLIFYSANLTDTAQSVALLNQVMEENRGNRFPLFLSVDQEGGRVSRLPESLLNFPTNQTIGNVNNPRYSYEIGKILGKELQAFGFNMNFAPVLDVNSNPDNPVIGDRSFSDDPTIVSELGIQTMKGIQAEQIIPVIKHFPGHGDTSVDSHLELPVVNKTLSELENLELIPFTEAIEDGADAVMVAHILLPELDAEYPATLSPTIINGLLREQMDFDGVVITDDMTMEAITDHYGIGEAAVQSVVAGSDILLTAHTYDAVVETYDALVAAVEEGVISEERIDESVARILHLKEKYDVRNSKSDSVNIQELNSKIRNLNEKYVD